MVKKIKGLTVEDPWDESLEKGNCLVVAERIKRTAKFLASINRGLQIVNLDWLKESVKARRPLDVNKQRFKLEDEEAECKWGFRLYNSIEKAREQKVFNGWKVWVSEEVQPQGEELQLIVESGGGIILDERPLKFSEDVICICARDEIALQHKLREQGYTPFSIELILLGVLRQELILGPEFE